MERYFALAKDDQRTLLQEAARRMNLPVQSIEKDLWVCWLLRKLMSLDPWGTHLTFKGGTSLSKAHGLIERFSADIDLVVDREALELVGENDPKKADSPTQIKQRVKRIAKDCHQWATQDLVPTFQQANKNDQTDPDWHLDLAPITEFDIINSLKNIHEGRHSVVCKLYENNNECIISDIDATSGPTITSLSIVTHGGSRT